MWPKINVTYLLLIIFFLTGCKGQAPESVAKILWPDLNDPYIQTTKNWTRKAALYSGIDTEIQVFATLKSLQWRKAYVHKYAQVYSLNQDEEKKLLIDELKAFQNETEFFLALYSTDPDRAKLEFNSPLWSVFLEIENTVPAASTAVRKVYPLEIRSLEWPYAKLKTFFPYVHKWQKTYLLRFNRIPEASGARLTLSGPVGKVSLEW